MAVALFASLEDEWGPGIPYSTSIPVLATIEALAVAVGVSCWIRLGHRSMGVGQVISDPKDRAWRRILAAVCVPIAMTPVLLVVASLVWGARAVNDAGSDVELGWGMLIVWAASAGLLGTRTAVACLHIGRLMWRGTPDSWAYLTVLHGITTLLCLTLGVGRWHWLLVPATLCAGCTAMAFRFRDEVTVQSQQEWICVTPPDPITGR